VTTRQADERRVPQPVLVLGIGNTVMGDDGAGVRAIERLAELPLPPHVRLQAAPLPGWDLPNWLEGWDAVILVDAVKMNQPPGAWRRLTLEEIRLLLEDGALSLHQPGLAAGLALAQALDRLPKSLTLYGIEPAEIAPGSGLSPAVETSLPDLAAGIYRELIAAALESRRQTKQVAIESNKEG